MLKVGNKELTPKDIALGVVLILVALAALWALVGSKPRPSIGQAPPPAAAGIVLMEGGQPGGGLGQFNYPRGIAVDNDGNLYVVDSRNHRIQKFGGDHWKLMTEFGGFANLEGANAKKLVSDGAGKFNEPNGICIGPDGTVYVIDTWNSRIQTFSPKGKHRKTFTAPEGFFGPREIAVDTNGNMYVADTGKHRIVKFNADGAEVKAWGEKGTKEGQFNEPIGLAVDPTGNVYVADRLNFRIQVFTNDGQYERQWPVKGWSTEQIDMEPHIALDNAHSLLYVTDGRGRKVYCYKLDGTLVSTLEKDSAGNELFMVPIGVAVDKDGFVYVVDAGAAKIFKLKGQF